MILKGKPGKFRFSTAVCAVVVVLDPITAVM